MGLPSLPLTWWAENIGGPTDFGDYQIAHLPPPSASVGAARWAAIFRTAHYQRGTWERQRGWDAEAIPCGPFCGVVTGEQREIQRPWVFGGVFASFCRRGQKDVAPEREIFPPEANMQDAGAARNRRTKNGPSGRQPLRGARPKPRETTRARGAEYLFSILPQKHKRLQRKVSFSRRGSLYLDRRRVSAPLPAACYQLSCVLYWATI